MTPDARPAIRGAATLARLTARRACGINRSNGRWEPTPVRGPRPWALLPYGARSFHGYRRDHRVAPMATQVAPYVCGANSPMYVVRIGSMQDLDITPRVATVLKIFLEDPDQPRYGFELMKLTGMASGSLYPVLAKLEGAGWLAKGKEDIDPRAAGRPARTNYTIVGAAVSAARIQLAELSERYRPPAPMRLRPQGGSA
jgi:PadR family transcriptional regulator PadR